MMNGFQNGFNSKYFICFGREFEMDFFNYEISLFGNIDMRYISRCK